MCNHCFCQGTYCCKCVTFLYSTVVSCVHCYCRTNTAGRQKCCKCGVEEHSTVIYSPGTISASNANL